MNGVQAHVSNYLGAWTAPPAQSQGEVIDGIVAGKRGIF